MPGALGLASFMRHGSPRPGPPAASKSTRPKGVETLSHQPREIQESYDYAVLLDCGSGSVAGMMRVLFGPRFIAMAMK